ncbi:MAG: flagellar motor protein MotB [Desulfobacteraceae bacterium]|jgi:chemotaxis protein MotB
MSKKKKIIYTLDTNAWMSTYTDLMTLLLTFFVLLLSLSSIDKKRKRLALNSLVGAFGFKPGGQSILGKPKGVNITAVSSPLVEEDVQFERLRNVALKHGIQSDLTMNKQLERTVIVLKNKVLFKHNSSELEKESTGFLSEITEILKEGHQMIELRGYSDSSESILEADPYKYSMILSSKRAIAMFDFFVEKGLTPGDIVAHGFGLNYPGRSKEPALNRQVEIILDYREKIPFNMRKKTAKDSFLDFKGFFFRTARDLNGRR